MTTSTDTGQRRKDRRRHRRIRHLDRCFAVGRGVCVGDRGAVEVIVVWDWYRTPGWYAGPGRSRSEGDAKHVLEEAFIDVQSEWPTCR